MGGGGAQLWAFPMVHVQYVSFASRGATARARPAPFFCQGLRVLAVSIVSPGGIY